MSSGVSGLERLTRVAKNHRLQVEGLASLKPEEQKERIRGMLNKVVYATAENWMKPSWLTSQSIEDGDETELQNSTQRNHVVIGLPGGRKNARCDSSGLLKANTHCGSMEFWIKDDGNIIFPALVKAEGPKLSLISPEDQLYEWSTTAGSVDFSRLMYHVEFEKFEAILNEVHLKNRTLDSTNFTFYVALRPMSSLGVEPIETLVYDENSGRLYANGYLALVLHQKPTAVYMSTADDRNLTGIITSEQKRIDQNYTTIRGLATAVLRYDLQLGPGESQELYFSNPLDEFTQTDKLPAFSPSSNLRTKTVQSWFKFSRETMGFEISNDVLQTAYTQAKASLAIQTYSEFKSKPVTGESKFWREHIRILLALLKIGCFDLVKKLISKFIEDDDRAETQYEFSVISPLVWMLTKYIDYSKDAEYLEEQSNFLNIWFDTTLEFLRNQLNDNKDEVQETESEPEPEIDTEKEAPELEPIEEGESSVEPSITVGEEAPSPDMSDESEIRPEPESDMEEDQPPLTFEYSEPQEAQDIDATNLGYIWTTEDILKLLWNYETLRKLAKTLKRDDTLELPDIFSKCESLFIEKLQELTIEPLEFLDILSSISLLNKVGFARTELDNLLQKMSDTLLTKGLVTISSLNKLYSSHLALRVGHYYCLTNQRYLVEDFLYRATEFLSEFHFLPEFVNLKTKGGSAGDGCSINAAADFILLLCDLLIYESGEDLVLLSGIPEEWYSSTTPITATAMQTKHGKVSIEIGTSANQHQIEVNMTSLPQEIEVHIPLTFSMPMVKVFGAGIAHRNGKASSPYIRVVPLSESVVLTAHK